jgi:hypothetical protein
MSATLRFSLYLLLSAISVCSTAASYAQGSKSSSGGASSSSGSGGGGKGSASGQGQGGQGSQGAGSAFFETQMLAYGAVNQLSYVIARAVCANDQVPPGSTIIIFDPTSFQNLQAWQAFKSSAEALTAAYETLLRPEQVVSTLTPQHFNADETLSVMTSGPFISSATDLASLLGAIAATTTNTASPFTIPDSAVAVSLLHQFERTCRGSDRAPKAFNLKYYPLFGGAPDYNTAQALVKAALDRPNSLRQKIQQLPEFMNPVPNAQNQPNPNPPPAGQGVNPNPTPGANTTNPRFSVFAELNAIYDQLLTTLITSIAQNQSPPQGGTQGGTTGPITTGVTSILQGAEIENALQGPDTFVLFADVAAAGGTQRDRKNLVSILTVGDFITYSGGLVVDFALVKAGPDEDLIMADTLRYRTKNDRLKHPSQNDGVENPNVGDNQSSINDQGPANN